MRKVSRPRLASHSALLQSYHCSVHPPQQIHDLPNRPVTLLGLLYSQEFHLSLAVFYSFSV